MDLLDWVMFFLSTSNPQHDIAAGAMSAKMTTIQIQYLTAGIPAVLSPADRDAFRQSVDDLYCLLLTSPPPDVSPLLLLSFRSTLRLMWLELGGPLGALGC